MGLEPYRTLWGLIIGQGGNYGPYKLQSLYNPYEPNGPYRGLFWHRTNMVLWTL